MFECSSKQGGDARASFGGVSSGQSRCRSAVANRAGATGRGRQGEGKPRPYILQPVASLHTRDMLGPGRGQASPLHFIVFSRGSGWLVDRNRGGRCLGDGSRSGRCLANSSRRDRRANNMPGLYLLFAIDVYAIAKVSEEAKCEANTVQTEQHITPEQRGDRCATYGSNDRSDVREGSGACCQSQ